MWSLGASVSPTTKWSYSLKALPNSKIQTIQRGNRNPSENEAFTRAREKSKKVNLEQAKKRKKSK